MSYRQCNAPAPHGRQSKYHSDTTARECRPTCYLRSSHKSQHVARGADNQLIRWDKAEVSS